MNRILPEQFDNRFEGHRAALWLLGLVLSLKVVISVNSLVNTADIASGADGFRLDSYGADGARAVLMLFALHSVAELALALVGIAALVRYRAMVPFVFVVLIAEFLVRRWVIASYAVERSGDSSAGLYVNGAFLLLMGGGLLLSLLPRRGRNIP